VTEVQIHQRHQNHGIRLARLENNDTPIIVKPLQNGDLFAKALFGYTINGNKVIVLTGEIQYEKLVYASAETELTIAADLTYVYVELEWATGTITIKQDTVKANATSSDACFCKWLYLLNYTAPSRVSVKTYGHTGGAITITPVFAPSP
jgi:hypothetical protein